MIKAMFAVIVGLLLFGCTLDPKAVNEKNFIKAINTYYAKLPCIVPYHGDILDRMPKKIISTSFNYKREKRLLDSFVSLGLLTAQTNTKKIVRDNPLTFKTEDEAIEQTTIEYNLTPKGEKYYSNGGFIYGYPEAVKIVRYTEPSDKMGHKVSRVIYQYSINDLAEWATSDAAKKMVPEKHITAVQSPIESVCNLVLTNNGWVHEGMLKATN